MKMTNIQLYNTIKRRLGVPYTFFELDYEDVMAIVKEMSFRYLAQWLPARGYVTIVADRDRVEGTAGNYKVPTDHDIVTIIDVHPSNSDVVVGYPITPINSNYEATTKMVTDVQEAVPNMVTSSALSYTWEFLPPDQIKLFPATFGFSNMIVYYEYIHEDLSTVPSTFGRDMIDLILSDIYDTLADIRGKYQQMSTPFGDLQLNSDTLRSQAENLKSKVYERLQSLPPNILVKGVN